MSITPAQRKAYVSTVPRWQKRGTLLLCLLLLTAVAGTRAQTGTTAVITGRSMVEKQDALALTLYFSLQDADGRPLPGAVVADASILLADGTVYPAQAAREPYYIVLALDASGSMAGLFEEARQEALAIVAAAPPDTQFAVIRFDDQINLEQSFTSDKEQAAAALQRMELAENGACIEDVGYTAAQTLAQAAPDTPGRAVLIFSDGALPAQAQGKENCGLRSYEQTVAYAAAQNTPIYALGDAGSQNTNLARLAEDSGGAALIIGADDLPERRQEFVDRLNSQWRARANLRPTQITQRGALLLTLDSGEPLLPAPFFFVTDRVYAAPEENKPAETLRLEISNFRYDDGRNLYELDVAANPSAGLHTLEVEVVDEANRQVGLTIAPDPQPMQRVTVSADGWPPGAYTARVRARDDQIGLLVRDEAGAVAQDRYEFQHMPAQPVLLQIEAVRVDDAPARLNLRALRLEDEPPELAVQLRLENGEQAAAFSGVLIRQSDNQQAEQFQFDAAREDGTAAARIPVEIEEGSYILALTALDEDGKRLAADNAVFAYTAADGALGRAGKALQNNWLLPFLWLATAVLAGTAGWYGGQLAGRRQAAAERPPGLNLNAPPPPEETASETQPVVLTLVESPDETLAAAGPWQIASFPFIIGREGCDLTIAHDYHVSRTHARITRGEEAYFLEDLGSANGTFLNATRLAAREPAALNAERGERITIGKTTTFLFEVPDH